MISEKLYLIFIALINFPLSFQVNILILYNNCYIILTTYLLDSALEPSYNLSKNLLLLPWILKLIVDMVNDQPPWYSLIENPKKLCHSNWRTLPLKPVLRLNIINLSPRIPIYVLAFFGIQKLSSFNEGRKDRSSSYLAYHLKKRKTFHLSIFFWNKIFEILSLNLSGVLTWIVIAFYESSLTKFIYIK